MPGRGDDFPAGRVERAATHGLLDKGAGPLLELGALLALAADDVLHGLGQRRRVDGVAIGLDARGLVQALVVVDLVAKHDDGLRPVGRAHDERRAVKGRLVREGGHNAQGQSRGLVHAALVDPLGHREVVLPHRELGAAKDIAVEDLADLLGDLRRVDLCARDLAGHLLLVVGKEDVLLAVAAGVVLVHQAVERGLDLLAQRHAVGAGVVTHQGGHVAHGRLDAVFPLKEEEQLEHVHVLGLQALAAVSRRLRRAVDHAANVALEEGLQRVVEHPKRDDGVLVLVLHALGRLLKAAEHRTLAAREVLARAAVAADLAHDVLHELELVVGKGEGLGKVVGVVVAHKVARGLLEGKEVAQDGRGLGVLRAEKTGGLGVLCQDAALDDLVGAGAGKREARVEAALDLREVVARDLDHRVDILLRGDHDPHAAGALGAQLLDDGLQVEHEVDVAANKLADLVGHEEQAELAAVGRCLGVCVVADLVGERLDREVGGVGAREPALGLGAAHDARLLKRVDDVVREEVVLGAGVEPGLAVDGGKGVAEGLGAAAVVDELL